MNRSLNGSFGSVEAINSSPNSCPSPIKGAANLLDLDPFKKGPNQAQLTKGSHQPGCRGLPTSLGELVGPTSPHVEQGCPNWEKHTHTHQK